MWNGWQGGVGGNAADSPCSLSVRCNWGELDLEVQKRLGQNLRALGLTGYALKGQ